MSYEIPTTPAGLRSEKAAATRHGVSIEQYRERKLAGEARCSNCDTWRPVNEFPRDASRRCGHGPHCINCRRPMQRAVYAGTCCVKGCEKPRKVTEGGTRYSQCVEHRREIDRLSNIALAAKRKQEPQERPLRTDTGRKWPLPYALRNSKPGAFTEALRRDTRGGE